MDINKHKEKIGQALRLERRMRELSQDQVCEMAGVAVSSQRNVEHGRAGLDLMYAVALALGMDWAQLTAAAWEAGDDSD